MELNDIKIVPLLDTLRLQKISDEVYFSEKYRNYVSNSRLGLINPQQDGSPEKFFEGFKMGYSSSLEIGSAVHELVLQPDLFVLQENTQKPTAKLGAMADRLYPVYDKTGKVTKEDVIEETAETNQEASEDEEIIQEDNADINDDEGDGQDGCYYERVDNLYQKSSDVMRRQIKTNKVELCEDKEYSILDDLK
jgi:hypothetical protein